MTLTESTVQTGSTILQVELRNAAAPGVAILAEACGENQVTLTAGDDSPLFLGQLRGYTK
jgi:hypothetical protein